MAPNNDTLSTTKEFLVNMSIRVTKLTDTTQNIQIDNIHNISTKPVNATPLLLTFIHTGLRAFSWPFCPH